VRADSGAFESPAIQPRRDWSHRFTAPGKYTYHCEPHTFMKGEISVREVKP
jgi:plastocyanin